MDQNHNLIFERFDKHIGDATLLLFYVLKIQPDCQSFLKVGKLVNLKRYLGSQKIFMQKWGIHNRILK